MTPRETLIAIAAPTADIGAHFYFHPATVATGKKLGLGGFPFYLLGRGGALGDVSAAVVSSAFGYFNPDMLAAAWNKYREVVSPPVAAEAQWNECAARGIDSLADVDGLDAYVDAADTVIAHTAVSGLPMFAGTAGLACSDHIAGRAMQKAAVLRELRGSAHLVAVLASGLTDAQAHAIKRPDEVSAFGWKAPPALPDDADDRIDAAEDLTNSLLEPAFSVLSTAQSDSLVAATTAMHAAIATTA